MCVLVVNAGSSSLKLCLIGPGSEALAITELDAPRAQIDRQQLREALAGDLGQADAVGHRIVHGGARVRAPALIDTEVETALRALTDLAPLHQPHDLEVFARQVDEVLHGRSTDVDPRPTNDGS